MSKQRLGILTGGGDTVALNRSIETIKNMAYLMDYDIFGIYGGWKGLLGEGNIVNISQQDINGHIGGSILGSSRTNPYKKDENGKDRVEEVLKNIERYKLDVIVSIGGDDTNGVSRKLWLDHGIPVIGFPKTIDNDLRTFTYHHHSDGISEVVLCPGYPSAAEKIARLTHDLRTTAMTYNRIFVVEVMGRDAGWLPAATAHGGADFVLVPEIPMTKMRIDKFFGLVEDRLREKKNLIIGVSEGVRWYNEETKKMELVYASNENDEFGHPRLGGISAKIANELSMKKIDKGARSQISGYIPRSGYISDYDLALATGLGQRVLQMLLHKEFGKMPTMKLVDEFRHIEAYNAHDIDLGQIGNFPLPINTYYDEENFTVTEKYKHFISLILGQPYKLPRRIEYKQVLPD